MKFSIVILSVLFSAVLFLHASAAGETYRKAVREFAAGNFSVSKNCFETVLRSVSKKSDRRIYSKSCAYLGDIYFYKGDGGTALKYYGKALEVYSKGGTGNGVRYRIGRTLVFTGKYSRGINELREFLVRKKAEEAMEDHALYWIARAYQGLGQKENALKTLDILTNLDPGTKLKNAVIRYRAELKNWDQKEEYQNDLKKIFISEEADGGLERGSAGPESEKTGAREKDQDDVKIQMSKEGFSLSSVSSGQNNDGSVSSEKSASMSSSLSASEKTTSGSSSEGPDRPSR